MDEKQGVPSDQPPMGYMAQPPPAYPGQPPVAGQQPAPYPVQTQPGYPAHHGPPPPGYPVQQQPIIYPGQPQAGYPGQTVVVTMPPGNRIPNNLVLAIIATLCCCPICGIIGIIYAAQVDSAFYRGDYAVAQNYSNNAKRWSIGAIVCGAIWIIIVIIYYILAVTVIYSSY